LLDLPSYKDQQDNRGGKRFGSPSTLPWKRKEKKRKEKKRKEKKRKEKKRKEKKRKEKKRKE
jgi:hypothetical protein